MVATHVFQMTIKKASLAPRDLDEKHGQLLQINEDKETTSWGRESYRSGFVLTMESKDNKLANQNSS